MLFLPDPVHFEPGVYLQLFSGGINPMEKFEWSVICYGPHQNAYMMLKVMLREGYIEVLYIQCHLETS